MAAHIDSMSVNTELMNVIYSLVEQKNCLIDELLLEKLLNEIQISQIQSPALLQYLDINRFVQALEASDLDHRLLAFGLKLTSLWTPSVNTWGNDKNYLRRMFEYLTEKIKNPNCTALIRSSTLQMLSKLIQNNELRGLISITDLLPLSVTLLSDSSIFVCNEAENFLTEYLSPSTDDSARAILDELLATFDKKSKIFFTHCTMVFKRICKTKQYSGVEIRLLETFWEDDEVFICDKICEVLAVIVIQKNEFSDVDNILRKLTTLGFVDIALKFCCNLLGGSFVNGIDGAISTVMLFNLQTTLKDLPSDLIIKLESYLLLGMNSLNIVNKTEKEFHAITSILLRLDFTFLTEKFQNNYIVWLCDLLPQIEIAMPKLAILVLEKLSSVYGLLKDKSYIKEGVSRIIKERLANDAVLIKALQVFGRFNDSSADDINNISESLSCLLYRPNWALQDSCLELLGKLSAESIQSHDSILISQLHTAVWEKLTTPNNESFVRATALIALAGMVMSSEIWQNLCMKCTEEKVLNHVLHLLRDDTEAVVRRAAAKTVTNLYRRTNLTDKWKMKLRSYMQNAVFDLDWEVKHGALDFWKNILNSEIPKKNQLMEKEISHLDKLGFCFSLVTAIEDYDSTVKFEAATILKPIQRQVKNFKLSPHRNNINSKQLCHDSNEIIEDQAAKGICQPMNDNVMEVVLNTSDMEMVTCGIQKSKKFCHAQIDEREHEIIHFGAEKFIETLLDLNLELIELHAQTNADIYVGNLELLVKDVLIMQNKIVDNEVIRDCY